jgi:hypothetical protein
MENIFQGPFRYDDDPDRDNYGRPIWYRIYDGMDMIICYAPTEEAAKWLVERLGN